MNQKYAVRARMAAAVGGLLLTISVALPVAAQGQASTPRLANGKPDLTGTWDNGAGIAFVRPVSDGESICISGCTQAQTSARPAGPPPTPDRPTYRSEHQARVADLDRRQVETDPVLRCMPPGVPRIGPPDKIVQRVDEVIFLYDDVSGNFFRIVPTDGRGHMHDAEPSYLGDAVGHWEGDTLVVETTNFNGETWLTDDGSMHTDELRVIERFERDGDTLTWQATAHDPAVLAEPWQLRPREAVLTDLEIVEAPPCIDRDLDHMVDGSSHDNPR
jgi:hypothetical protein